MVTNKWYAILLQLVIFGFHKSNSQTLTTTSCVTVLQNYFDFLTMPHPGTARYITIQAVFILQNRYGSYFTGSLTFAASVNSLNGTTTVAFSDRTWTPSCDSFFCPYQNFNYKNTDIQTITISRSGAIQYILNSWGNAKLTDQLQCYGVDEPLYTAPIKQSPSMFVMTLQKQEYTIPK